MTIRTLAATLGGAALLATAATPAMAQTSTAKSGHHSKKPARNVVTANYTDTQLTTVATALGVSLDDLKTARASVKTAIAATSTRETPAQVNALLATALGGTITADQVKTAFASLSTSSGSSTTGSSDYPSDSGSYPSDGTRGGGCDHGSGGSQSGYPSDSSGNYPSDSTTSNS